MIRALLYAVLSIVAITVIRLVAGLVMKAVADSLRPQGSPPAGQRARRGGAVPTSGELKPCQSCGAYVLASVAKTLQFGSSTAYFCSEDCRKKARP
ncbi:MAG: hypothetical protein NZV14_11515 [Bryobacteraceae bacterium]|nr:hypothetical protein [Bryobacteraceae bacterium]MDW8378782.1 hypothetical protein [Bryobacterales bacterium]